MNLLNKHCLPFLRGWNVQTHIECFSSLAASDTTPQQLRIFKTSACFSCECKTQLKWLGREAVMVTEFPREACLHHSQDDCDAGSLSLSETLSLNCFFFFFPVLFFDYYHTHGKWGLKQHCYGSWVLTFIQGRVGERTNTKTLEM